MDTKEQILTYVKQYETDASIDLTPDRTRRSLLRRFHRAKNSGQAYADLIAARELHETGTGKPGDPIIVVIGPPPDKQPVKLEFPYDKIEKMDVIDFLIRVQSVYEEKGWSMSAFDIKGEIKKAFAEYQPGRPY